MLSSIQCHFGLFGLLGGTVPVPRAFLVLKGWLRNMQLACFFSRSPGRRLLATGDTFWKIVFAKSWKWRVTFVNMVIVPCWS